MLSCAVSCMSGDVDVCPAGLRWMEHERRKGKGEDVNATRGVAGVADASW
jgi:hypothetical protein